MKNYKEVADSVFKRSEEIIAQNKKRRRERLMSIGATAGCLIVAGAVGIGVWKNMGRADIPVASDIDLNWSSASQYVNSTTATIDNIYDSSTASSKNDTANGAVVSGEVGVTSVAESSTETDIVNIASGSSEVGVTSNAESSTESDKNDIANSASGSGEVSVTSIPESSAESVESNTANSAPESSADNSDIIFPAHNDTDTSALSGTPLKTATVIEEYESNVVTDYIGTPENGTYRVSDDLREAMDEYGYTDGNGDIVYHVMAYYYENGTPVDVSASAICDGEWNRLCGHGYHCEYETCGRNWGAEYDNHFCMRLTREQIENFTPADNLGCELCLYCEGKQRCILSNPDVNYSSSSTSTPIAQNPGHHHGYGYGAGDGTGYGYGSGNGYGNGCGTGYGHHHGGC